MLRQSLNRKWPVLNSLFQFPIVDIVKANSKSMY